MALKHVNVSPAPFSLRDCVNYNHTEVSFFIGQMDDVQRSDITCAGEGVWKQIPSSSACGTECGLMRTLWR